MSLSKDSKQRFNTSYSVDFFEKNEVVYRDRGYFEAKSRSYDETMKRAVKENSLRMSDILRNKRIS